MNWGLVLDKLRQALPEHSIYFVAPLDPQQFDSTGVEIALQPGSVEVENQGEIATITALHRRFFSVSTKVMIEQDERRLEQLRDRQQGALIGWRYPETNSAIQYEGGDLEYIDGLLIQWVDVYSITYTLSYRITGGPHAN